ncbi:MAG: CCA tRNA nucleotidyltransferase [Thermoplasmatales archaeon]|nr:CCA tRNA nucleotidyltransferase [Thermoplasmatales archaeon]
MLQDRVLKNILPTSSEALEIKRTVEELKSKCADTIKKLGINAEPILVGSVAKGTYLKKPDIDIFIMFPTDTKRSFLEKYGLKIGETVLNGERKYAEHPYTTGIYKGYEVDIVPCYKITNVKEKMSAVDRTPFHTKYIIENLKDEQKNDVRLLKQFMKGVGVYGAEASVQGFSGYLCELLILKYGSFASAVKEAGCWKRRILIGSHAEKFDGSMVFVDPVDEKRNVASALSAENISLFTHACREYIKNPRAEFFFPKKPKPLSKKHLLKMMNERGTGFTALIFGKPDTIDDNLYPQLRKCEKSIVALCAENDFKIVDSAFYVNDEIFMVFELESLELPNMKKHYGPMVFMPNAKDFREKWEKDGFTSPYIEKNRWVVNIKRKHINVKDLINEKITGLSTGKDVSKSVRKKFKIVEGKNILQKKYFLYMTMFIDKKFRWEY